MKNHLVTAEYILFSMILIFFALPPLFISPSRYSPVPSISPRTVAVHMLLCFFLYSICKNRINAKQKKIPSGFGFLQATAFSVFALAVLCFSSIFFRFTESFFNAKTAPIPDLPAGKTELIFLIFSTVVFACYEEILYRLYMPVYFCAWIHNKEKQKKLLLFLEALPVVLFALAHRYAGFFAVGNALAAAVVFRFLVKKTGTVWGACLVHCAYNLIALFIR